MLQIYPLACCAKYRRYFDETFDEELM